MKPLRRCGKLVLVMLLCMGSALSQNASAIGRSYAFSLDQVKRTLQDLGAYTVGKLPMLDGFVPADTPLLASFERPYYQFRIELTPMDAGHTKVAIEARISAWYTDADATRSGYRSLASNGRLESDLLDRLQATLGGAAQAPDTSMQVSSSRDLFPKAPSSSGEGNRVGDVADSPQRELEEIIAEKLSVDEKANALKTQIRELQAAHSQPPAMRLASVKRPSASVRSQMNSNGPVLFRARAEDEFEVVKKAGEWVEVRLDPDSTGWIAAADLTLPEPETAKSPDQSQLGFWVSREQINDFAGDWPELKGRKALFVFAQPRGSLPELANDDRKLTYVKQVFADRYRTASLSKNLFDGVVVIFIGGKGGVAAATMKDIKQWVQGSLADDDFVKRCSLDPPSEFQPKSSTAKP